MLFSVIIPVFNRAAFVEHAINSALAQPGDDFELIAVDDGSTDATPQVLQRLGARAKIITQTNRGPGAARNHGAKAATGDYLLFLDSDDVWFPWTLATYRDLIRQQPDVAMVLGSTLEFRRAEELDRLGQQPARFTVFRDYFSTSQASIFRGSGVMAIRKDLFTRTGGFSEDRVYSEDLDFLIRCGESGPVAVIAKPVTLARRSHSQSSAADMKRTFDGMQRLLQQEKLGVFPGGANREWDRRRLLCIQAREVSNWCLKARMNREAWQIYRQTFWWQLRLAEFGHLVKIPILTAFPWLRTIRRSVSGKPFNDADSNLES